METKPSRKPYPSDDSDDEWAFVAPYLTLMPPDAPQRVYNLREVYNALRWIAAGICEPMVHDLRALLRWAEGRADAPTAAILDSRTLRSTPESGTRAGYDGHKRKKGSKLHLAVDTLGLLLALHVTPAHARDRAQVATLAAAVQAATGTSVKVAFVDQGYTGEQPEADAARHGLRLEVVKLPDAKRGFVLLPRRWVVERSFARASRFRRLARDHGSGRAGAVGSGRGAVVRGPVPALTIADGERRTRWDKRTSTARCEPHGGSGSSAACRPIPDGPSS